MALTRAEILAANDLPRELVSVPEWGGDVYVRSLTAGERDKLEGLISNATDKASVPFRALFAAAATCDENGVALFSDLDVIELKKKSGAAIDRIFDVAMRLSRMRKEDVDELEKN